ncbi:hypothetical protein [Chlorogloeopsis sp. ULAP01]
MVLNTEDAATVQDLPKPLENAQDIDQILNSLKTLLNSVEKV